MEKDISCKWKKNGNSDKIDFKTKAIVRDKERYCIMIKGTIQQEDIILVNIYVPNTGAPKYVNKNLGEIKGRDWQ